MSEVKCSEFKVFHYLNMGPVNINELLSDSVHFPQRHIVCIFSFQIFYPPSYGYDKVKVLVKIILLNLIV